MKKHFLVIMLLFVVGAMSAQEELTKEEKARREKNIEAGNPFRQFGYKAKVATLSKGKYLEVQDLDSIVTIGSVRFHVDRQEIVGFVEPDTINGVYARPIGDVPSRWLSPDPLSEEFSSWSPYNMCFNNPLKFVDPDGMAATDWFKDLKGFMQFDPKVQSQGDLGNKGTYVGDTAKETTKNGGTADFRKDGSIMYSNEKDAYSRIWNNTHNTGREQTGVIGDKGVLILPDYKNTSIKTETDGVGYSFKGGNLQDPLSENSFNTLGTIHAHLSGEGPSTWLGSNYGDLGFASGKTPYKPVFVMEDRPSGVDNVSFIIAAPGVPNKFNYQSYNITQSVNPAINAQSIQTNTSLRSFIKTNDLKGTLRK